MFGGMLGVGLKDNNDIVREIRELLFNTNNFY